MPWLQPAQIYGNAVPTRDLTSETSLPLIAPLAFTSERKFVESTVWPIRALVCETSASLIQKILRLRAERFIDRRSPEERKWMTAYLLDEIFSVPELRQTAKELAELARRRADIVAGHNRAGQQQAEAHGMLSCILLINDSPAVTKTVALARCFHGAYDKLFQQLLCRD